MYQSLKLQEGVNYNLVTDNTTTPTNNEPKYYDILPEPLTFNVDKYSKVSLIDVSPRICPVGRQVEHRAIIAARTSYGQELRDINSDEMLFRYLVRNKHTSPLEFIRFVFLIECPIYVARHIMRHRTFSFNEYSLRYSKPIDNYHIPETFRRSHKVNKQSSDEDNLFVDEEITKEYELVIKSCTDLYDKMIAKGICKEQARTILPVSQMTKFYATIDLNNFYKFLYLRYDKHTQLETRLIAEQMYKLAINVAPLAMKCYDEYYSESITLTKKELISLLNDDPLESTSKSEIDEWKHKSERIFEYNQEWLKDKRVEKE
jgi:thymidylate synthase (FAD)